MNRQLALVAVTTVMMVATVALPVMADSRPSPFAAINARIATLQRQCDALDPATAEAQIKKIRQELIRLYEQAEAIAARLTRPYETKIKLLTAKKEKLLKQGKPTDQIEAQIQEAQARIAEIDKLAVPEDDNASAGNAHGSPAAPAATGKCSTVNH